MLRGVPTSALLILILSLAVGSLLLLALWRAGPSSTPDLSDVRVVILYERVTDGGQINRSLDDVAEIVEETGADMVFRGFWVWGPILRDCSQLPERYRESCELSGRSYSSLEEAISRLKEARPLIFCGAVPAQKVFRRIEYDPRTGRVFRYPETWEMALDPGKWGIPVSKEEFQCEFGRTHLWVERELNCSDYDPREASAYFPDITDERFQGLLLGWALEQVDRGADAIWIDMLLAQARMMGRLTGDPEHPAVRDALDAARGIVQEIKRYGESLGRRVYVGSWWTAAIFPDPPELDFVTMSPAPREVRSMELDEARWEERIRLVRERLGDVPIIVMIDWAATSDTPLGVFSQELSPEQQREFLRRLDEFCRERGLLLAYPVHGGWMGKDAVRLSFGRFRFYDSLAPEFQTYETIVELATARRVGG